MNQTKPFNIPKQLIFDAYKRVKANKGSAGVEAQSLADFEQDLKSNLYKLWNRMSSSSNAGEAKVLATSLGTGYGHQRVL